MRKKVWTARLLCLLLVMETVFGSMAGSTAFAETAVENAQAQEEVKTEETEDSQVPGEADGTYYYRCGDSCEITYTINSRWESEGVTGYTAAVEISNTGDEAMEGFSLSFSMEDTIVNLWNAAYEVKENETSCCIYKVSALPSCGTILPGGTFSFGFQAEAGADGTMSVPKDVALTEIRQELPAQAYEFSYTVDNQWDCGYIVNSTLKNLSGTAIKGWQVTFLTRDDILNLWNAAMQEHGTLESADCHTVASYEYNSEIQPGGSVSFGFQGSFEAGSLPDYPVIVAVTAVMEGELQPAERVEGNENGEPDELTPEELEELRRWNRSLMNVDSGTVEEAMEAPEETIKVALADSGVDYMEGLPVAERINFIPGEDEMSAMFEDSTGHGVNDGVKM